MPFTEKKVIYRAFGLSFTSEIFMPELTQIENPVDLIDVEIRIEKIPAEFLKVQKNLVINKSFVSFKVPEAAIFTIHGGKRIIVSPMEQYDEDLIRLYLLGSCMGVVLLQRGIFPLHGSAVAINGKAYAFIGESGAGKSTLASAFLNRGYQLLSDDIVAVSFNNENQPMVIPAYPQQKLWQESLKQFGVETSRYRSIHGRETKYCVPVASQYYAEPMPLGGIFELSKTGKSGIEIKNCINLERFHKLYLHTYRNFLIDKLGLIDWHFNLSARILNSVNVYDLHRPDSVFSAPGLVTSILDFIEKGER